jgi:hypothetical protein
MNEEFVNVYIEMMNKKIEELTRSELMMQTRLAIAEKLIASLQADNQKMKVFLDKKAPKTKEVEAF